MTDLVSERPLETRQRGRTSMGTGGSSWRERFTHRAQGVRTESSRPCACCRGQHPPPQPQPVSRQMEQQRRAQAELRESLEQSERRIAANQAEQIRNAQESAEQQRRARAEADRRQEAEQRQGGTPRSSPRASSTGQSATTAGCNGCPAVGASGGGCPLTYECIGTAATPIFTHASDRAPPDDRQLYCRSFRPGAHRSGVPRTLSGASLAPAGHRADCQSHHRRRRRAHGPWLVGPAKAAAQHLVIDHIEHHVIGSTGSSRRPSLT